MLKQLPGETPRAATRPRRHSASPSGAGRVPACAGGAGARWTGTPAGARHRSAHGVGAAPAGMAELCVSRAPTLRPCRGASPSPGRGSLLRQLHPFMGFSCHGLRAQLPGARVRLPEPQKAGTVRYTRVLSLSSPPAPASSATAGGARSIPVTGHGAWALTSVPQGWEKHRRARGHAHPQGRAGHRPSESQAEDPSHLYKAKTFPSAK